MGRLKDFQTWKTGYVKVLRHETVMGNHEIASKKSNKDGTEEERRVERRLEK